MSVDNDILGAFHSTKTSGLNFRQLSIANGTAFSVDCTGNDDFPTFPEKRSTSRAKFSKKFSRKFSFHSTLLPEFLQFSVEWFAFRKFNSFRNFWKLFQEIYVPFAAVSKFSKVLVEWKAPFVILTLKRLCYNYIGFLVFTRFKITKGFVKC